MINDVKPVVSEFYNKFHLHPRVCGYKPSLAVGNPPIHRSVPLSHNLFVSAAQGSSPRFSGWYFPVVSSVRDKGHKYRKPLFPVVRNKPSNTIDDRNRLIRCIRPYARLLQHKLVSCPHRPRDRYAGNEPEPGAGDKRYKAGHYREYNR